MLERLMHVLVFSGVLGVVLILVLACFGLSAYIHRNDRENDGESIILTAGFIMCGLITLGGIVSYVGWGWTP